VVEGPTKKRFTIHVDGVEQDVHADPAMPLLYVLRNIIGRKGPKFGCGLAQCGACTVILNGSTVRSCVVPIASVTGKVRTLDGLGTPQAPHPLQQAFIEEEAGQCAYCISGWIMTATVLLEENPDRSDQEIRDALVGIKCRCGAHMAILRAIRRAADRMKS
jgi:aerobic-type carbon monoxide dehydrogenase small subunit (CoxS/CutS family)